MAALPFHDVIPLYHQISQVLRLRVDGSAPFQLGTEASLCEEFGVSRSTIRQALASLKREGLVQGRRGVGTRVVESNRVLPYTRSSGDPLHAALGSERRLLHCRLEEAPAGAAAFLGLPPGSRAFSILRVESVVEGPISVVASWLPPAYAEGITKADLRDRSVHDLLWQKFRIRQRRSLHTVRVARADARVAGLLGVALADPVLYIQSSVRLDDGRPIRWTENWFREDRYQYTAEMQWPTPSRAAPKGKREAGR